LAAACTGSEPGAQQGESAPAPASSPWNEIPMEAGTFHEQTGTYRTDVIDIPLRASGELEYKLHLKQGATITYEWNALNLPDPQQLYAEFHGHTERVGNAPGDLMFYRKASGASEKGMLVAPFTGIHGWYLRNDGDEAVVVRLKVAGFYELLPE
jgi:hypothetical protein